VSPTWRASRRQPDAGKVDRSRRATQASGFDAFGCFVTQAMPRPSKPLISPDDCARVALSIIDVEGLDALSLERLAREIGVKAPSLYHHFADKAEILTRVTRQVLLEVPVPPEPSPGNWEEWFVEMCLGFRRAILAHPNAAPLLLQYYTGDFMVSTYERASRVLSRAGVPVERHMVVLAGLDKLTLGSGLYAASRLVVTGQSEFANIDPERDLMLARALEANPWDEDGMFTEIVRSFLRGVIDATPGRDPVPEA
jgi:TetR/AcrR family tetracycline transcriptional repressor